MSTTNPDPLPPDNRNTSLERDTALDDGYKAMAADKDREAEAMEWCNALTGDHAAG